MVFGAELAKAIRMVVTGRGYGAQPYRRARFLASLVTNWSSTDLLIYDPDARTQETTAVVNTVTAWDMSVSFQVVFRYGKMRIRLWDSINGFCIDATAADLAYYCAPVVIPVGTDLMQGWVDINGGTE